MTVAQGATGRRVNSLRYSARLLGVTWAVPWVLMLLWTVHCDSKLSSSFGQWMARIGVRGWLMLAVWVLTPAVSMAVAWRREAIGAAMMFLAALLSSYKGWPILLAALPGYFIHKPWSFAMMPVGLASIFVAPWLALAAAILFLTSWWRSRTPTRAEASE